MDSRAPQSPAGTLCKLQLQTPESAAQLLGKEKFTCSSELKEAALANGQSHSLGSGCTWFWLLPGYR